MPNDIAVKGPTGSVERTGLTETMSTSGETSSTALAAREQALIQARLIVAMQRPRNIERFRVRLLDECKRPGFAEIAEYSRPVGREKNKITGGWEDKFATGPSIRMIEAAIQFYGNLDVNSRVTFESDQMRIIECYVWDLETNAIWSKQQVIAKTTEKRAVFNRETKAWGPPAGRAVVGERLNTEGHTTYVVLATEDETRVYQSNLESRIQRKNAERLLPKDVLDEGLAVCHETMKKRDKEDPVAAMRKIIDGFHGLGVDPEQLTAYIGKTVDKLTADDIASLRKLYVALRDGETTWAEVSSVNQSERGSADAAKDVADKKKRDLFDDRKSQAPATGTLQFITPEQVSELEGVFFEHSRSGFSEHELWGCLGKHFPGITRLDQIPASSYDLAIRAIKEGESWQGGKTFITEKQVGELNAALKLSTLDIDEFFDGLYRLMGINSFASIPADSFDVVMTTIKEATPQPKDATKPKGPSQPQKSQDRPRQGTL